MNAFALPSRAPDVGSAARRSMATVTLAWIFGSVYFTAIAGAPLTLFAAALGASPFVFGLLAAAPFAASLLSLPAGIWSDRTGQRKRIFFLGMYPNRLLWFAAAGVPILLWKLGYGSVALGSFVGFILLAHCLGALGGPAWMGWMADVVPRRIRGTYFARRKQIGILSALPTALFVGWILDQYVRGHESAGGVGPERVLLVCGTIFAVAAVFGIVDIALFHRVPHETPAPQPGPALASLKEPLKDRQFLAFAAFVATLTLASAPSGTFITLLLVERAGVSGLLVQTMLLVMPLIGSMLTSGIWGRAVDRLGKKPVLRLCGLGTVPVGLGWAAIAMYVEPGQGLSWPWLILAYVISFGSGAAWSGVEVANFNYVLELAGGRPGASKNKAAGGGYVAVNSVVVNVAGMSGGLLFGAIAGATAGQNWDAGLPGGGLIDGLTILFILSGALRLLSVTAVLPLVVEARHRPAREAMSFVTTNLYNNLQTALLQPIRMVRVRVTDSFRPRG